MIVSEFSYGRYVVELTVDEQLEVDRRVGKTKLSRSEVIKQRLLVGLFPERNIPRKGKVKNGL